MTALAELVDFGALHPTIAGVFPLAGAAKAHTLGEPAARSANWCSPYPERRKHPFDSRSLEKGAYPKSSLTSDAVMADPNASPSSTTAVNNSRLRSCNATTFSSMVPCETSR